MPDTLTLHDKQAFVSRIEHDPVWFCQRILGASLWGKQQEIAQALVDTQFVYVPSCHASGKCVAQSEYITLADGSRKRATDLVGTTFNLLTLNDGEVIRVPA